MSPISRRRRAAATLRGDLGGAIRPLADQIVVTGSNFAISIIIARAVGAYQFGLYSLAWFCVLIALSLQLSFIGAPLFNLAPRRPPEDQPGYIAVMAAEQLVFSAAFFVLAWVAAAAGGLLVSDWAYGGFALSLAAAGSAYLWQDGMRRCLFARGRTGAVLGCDLIGYPGQALGLLLAARAGAGLPAMLWVTAAAFGSSAALATIALQPLRLPHGRIGSILAEQWGYARWLLGAVALSEIAKNIAYFVAGALVGAADVAGMRAAELLFRISNPFFQSLENFVPANATRLLRDRGSPAFIHYLLRWTLIGLAISIAILLVAAAAPGFWLSLFFGGQMAGYGALVYAMALRTPIVFLTMMAAIVLRTRDATAFAMLAEFCRTAVAVATVYPVVAGFGIIGAAVAHATWPLVALAVMAVGIRRCLRRPLPAVAATAPL